MLSFLAYPHLSYLWSLVLFCTMDKEIGSFSTIIYQNYPLQHWRKLFYNLQLLIHYLQMIRHKHISRLNLIIKTWLLIRTFWAGKIYSPLEVVVHKMLNKLLSFWLLIRYQFRKSCTILSCLVQNMMGKSVYGLLKERCVH